MFGFGLVLNHKRDLSLIVQSLLRVRPSSPMIGAHQQSNALRIASYCIALALPVVIAGCDAPPDKKTQSAPPPTTEAAKPKPRGPVADRGPVSKPTAPPTRPMAPPAPGEGAGGASPPTGKADRRFANEKTTRSRSLATDGAQSRKWDVVPVYYGTDRARDDKPKRIGYGPGRAKRLELGRALVTVPKSHEVPNVERPWVYKLPFTQIVIYQEKEDPAKHFTLKALKALTKEEFLALVRARLNASKNFKSHALVFVHGFSVTFDNALYRTAQIAYDLKFDGAPFLYSWPSNGAVSPQDYSNDRESTGQAEPHLKKFLQIVSKETGAKKVSLIAHSMGNQLVMRVLRDIKQSAPSSVSIGEIILAAPDVDRDTFEFLAKEIKGLARGMTLLAASNDRALTVSRSFWGGSARAGEVPADTGPLVVAGIDTIDVTAVNTELFSLNHSGYAKRPVILKDIEKLIKTSQRPPKQRLPILLEKGSGNNRYWSYPTENDKR